MNNIYKSITNGAGASFLTSAINFTSFIILPSYASYTSDFTIFSEANIYSGFYNSVIAVSAGSVALMTLHTKSISYTRLYFLISFLIIVGFLLFSEWRESELILAYAILSIQNYIIVSKRYLSDSGYTAYKLAFQPVIFFLSVSLQKTVGWDFAWTTLYLYCAIFSLMVCRHELRMIINKIMRFENNLDFKRLVYLLLSCAALPLLVQMDLPFININNLDIAFYSVAHRIAYSIPVAITGINVPLLVGIYEHSTRQKFMYTAMIITLAVCFMVTAILVFLNLFSDIYFDNLLIASILFLSASYAFINIMLSVGAIIYSRKVFYIVSTIILVSSFGYFFQSYVSFIIYKGIILLLATVIIFKFKMFEKIHE